MIVATKKQFWEFLTNLRKDLFNAIPMIQDAIVVGLNEQGKPIIRFLGEGTPSQKIYPHYKSYVPAVGDRVQLVKGIIQGGWKP